MNKLLEDFVKSFTSDSKFVAVTWWRDVDFVPIDPLEGNPGMIPWGMEVSAEPTYQQLVAIRLKWNMDVDEMFYMGDGLSPGLLNGEGFGNPAGDSVLIEPIAFGRSCVTETRGRNDVPCKWLQLVDKERFSYDRSKLLFKLAWPRLAAHVSSDGFRIYYGGMTPLSLK